MTLRTWLGVLVALALIGPALPAAAQDVPPLQMPDVTHLLKPPAGGAADATTLPAPGDQTSTDDANTPPCGTQPITIARMAWPSAALLAEIHARVLRAQYDCDVQVLQTDLAPALSGMESTGQPAVAPEMWVSRVADQWNQAVKDQKLRQVGLSYAGNAFEGWYVPDYAAADHPELKSAAALKDDWQLFSEGGPKGKFVSCPADWACAIINRNLIKAEGLDSLYDVVEPKNRFDLDQTIAAAISRKQPIVFYYWQPNAALAQFGFKPVDLGAFSKDDFACLGKRECPDPKPSSFAPEPVVIALASWVFTDAPEVAAYFQRAQMPMDEMNKLLAQLNEPGATVESVADKFVAERQEVWQRWIGTPSTTSGSGAGSDAGAAAPSSGSDTAPPADTAAPPTSRPSSAPPASRPSSAPSFAPPQSTPAPRTVPIPTFSHPTPSPSMQDLPPPSLTQN